MTRKGEKQENWTTEQLRYLCAHAGHKSAEEMALHLGRTPGAIYQRAHLLDVSVRVRNKNRLVWCVHCAKPRPWVDEDGLCSVCRAKRSAEGMRLGLSREVEEAKREEQLELATLRREMNRLKQVKHRTKMKCGKVV
jgi:hypothetical protein